MIQIDEDGNVYYVREDNIRFYIGCVDPVKPLVRFVTNTRIEGIPAQLLPQLAEEVHAHLEEKGMFWFGTEWRQV